MKKFITSAICLWVLIAVTVSCAKNPRPVSAEANIQALSRSLFEPGATVPDNGSLVLLSDGASGVTTDGGFIAPPNQTGSGDSGSISGPGGGDTSSGTGVTPPVTEVLPPPSETGTGNSSETSSGGSGSDQANSGSNSGSTSGSSGTGSGGGETSGPGGNDGGVLNPPTGDQTADNGGISNGGSSGGDSGQSGGSSIDNVDPGAVVINENGNPVPQPGTSTGGSDTSGSSSTTDNSGTPGSSSDTSSNDTGSISPGTSTGGADGGSTGSGNTNVVDNGGTGPVTPETGDSGNGSSTGGTNVADGSQGGSTGGSTGGTTGGTTDTPGSNDTGSISPGTSTGGADGGSTGSGNSNVVDNGGTGPVTPETGDSGNGSSTGGTNVADGSQGGSTGGSTGGTDGGNTGSGNTNVVDNGGTTPSVPTCPGANQPNPKPCGCVPQKPNNQFVFQLRRVCSLNRSKGDGLFFEEAKNPIITIEHVTQSKGSSAYYAAFGYGKYPTEPKTVKGYTGRSLAYLSLKGVDLFKGPYKSKTTLMLENFKKAAGFWWWTKYVNVRVCEDSNNDGFCFDEPNKHQLAFEVPQFKSGQLPRSLQIDVWSGRHLTKSKNPNSCESQYSPLVLDLKGNGLDLLGPEKGVSFDLNDTGSPIRTGWIGAADDALLVRDLNGSRRIESGAELFGSATRLPSGARAVNGFEALRPLDSNNDGLITDRDLAWSELKLWIDGNKDGVSQRSELLSLDRAGVESIDLRYADVLEVDEHGNQTRERSSFVRKVWGKRYVLTVSDVWFNTFSLD